MDLIASRRFSDFPLPDSPLKRTPVTKKNQRKYDYIPKDNTLILGRPPHMIVSIICDLEDMGWQLFLLFGGISVSSSVLLENGIRS